MKALTLTLTLALVVVLAACSDTDIPWRSPPPVAVDLKMRVSVERVGLLQPIEVQLDLFRRGDLEVEFAPTVDPADFLAETVALPEVEFGDGYWRRITLTLRPVRGPGELMLPAFLASAVDGTAQARTEERRIVVESALAGHDDRLEAPAAPFPSPPRTLLYVAIGGGVLLLLAGLWWLTRRRGDRPTPVATAVPPHVKALRALERLRAAPRSTPPEVERFYVDVSGVLRHYLEDRFGLHAPERTTEEFLRELESGDALARGHRAELQQFLSQCDLVKFARARPLESDHVATFALAEAFVERTRSDRARSHPVGVGGLAPGGAGVIAAWEIGGLTLLDPWFLLAIPCALVAVLWRALRPRAALPTGSASLYSGAPRTLRQRLQWLPLAVKFVAAASLGIALARPVERQVVPMEEEGIDILLVVDTSTSMKTEDMSDSERVRRMDAARARAEEFAAARINDRVGLVAFARFAELRCPLTLDEEALAAFLRALDTVPDGSQLDGTAIGTALAKAVQVLDKSEATSKVVVLLTDGETTVFDISPEDGAKLAKDAGVRVHTIGLGKGQLTPSGFRPFDFADLRMIAETTGGQFFEPRSDEDLAAVYARIDELEKSELDDPRYRTVDRFEWPLAVGLLALLIALLGEALLFRRVP